jgi:hypothetical protein
MTTAAEIIDLSFRAAGIFGVGQTPLADNVQTALRALNMMIGQWNRNRWLIYHLIDTSKGATGALSYTVGPTGDFNIPRPERLEYAYFRQTVQSPNNPIDYPLQILESREDYSAISIKSLNSFPLYAFYDSAYPLANLFVWPVPSNLYEIHIVTKAILTTFANTTTVVNLPPEYEEALYTNLAVRLCPLFQVDCPPDVKDLARAAQNTIENANTQIPRLRMPAGLNGGNLYNIYSDQSYNR